MTGKTPSPEVGVGLEKGCNIEEYNDSKDTSGIASISIEIVTFVDKEFTLHSGINKL